jgi:hypothetical protein
MRREDLDFAIQTAAAVIGQDHVLVLGSQSILGSFHEDQLPQRATMSNEVDIAPLHDDANEMIANLLDVELGEWSDFDAEHGFYVQGVSVYTAYLPDGWASRVVEVRPRGDPACVGLCLEPHDLCAAKLARFDEKDREFVGELLAAGLVRANLICNRLAEITDPRFERERKRVATRWIKHRESV